MPNDKYLRIYLADHLSGSLAGYELARRCHSSNRGGDLGNFLRDFISELESERRELEHVIEKVDARKDPVKLAAAWTAEKVGRLKLNGQLTGYSDLSRLVELEGLRLGVEGKLSLWRSLKQTAVQDERLAGIDFDRLISTAESQIENLERFRLQAAAIAFEGVKTS